MNKDILSALIKYQESIPFIKRRGNYCEIPGLFCVRDSSRNGTGATIGAVLASLVGAGNASTIVAAGGTLAFSTTVLPVVVAFYFFWIATCGREECDECREVNSIGNITDHETPCEWGDFVAYGGTGNTFEEVQEFIWEFRFPNSSIPPLVIAQSSNVVNKSQIAQIETLSTIDVKVDVVCDENTLFPWKFPSLERFTLEDHQQRDLPEITAPPTDTYFYPAGTELCFRISTSYAWAPIAWQAPGGVPETSNVPSYDFCTTFDLTSTLGVGCTIRNRCTGEEREINNSFLVIHQ